MEAQTPRADNAAAAVPDQPCLFMWISRREAEQCARTPAAGTYNAATPASNEKDDKAPPATAAAASGAIPLTPIGGDVPTDDNAPPADESAPPAAATSAPAGSGSTPATTPVVAAARKTPGAGAVRPQEATGPLTAPHILDMLASQAADSRATARKSAVQLAGSTISLLQAAAAPAALLQEAHERVLPLLQRLVADVSVSVRRAVLDVTVSLMQSDGSRSIGTPTGSAWLKVWARIILPLVQDAEPTVFEAAINEVLSEPRCFVLYPLS
jgi:hypothetical protein